MTQTGIPSEVLLRPKRLDAPTVYNVWEAMTQRKPGSEGFNFEAMTDFTPHMEPMVGYAVTLAIEPRLKEHRRTNPNAVREYRE